MFNRAGDLSPFVGSANMAMRLLLMELWIIVVLVTVLSLSAMAKLFYCTDSWLSNPLLCFAVDTTFNILLVVFGVLLALYLQERMRKYSRS